MSAHGECRTCRATQIAATTCLVSFVAAGEELRIVVAGYIRPEANFESLNALIERIHTDADVTREALTDDRLALLKLDPFLRPVSAQEI